MRERMVRSRTSQTRKRTSFAPEEKEDLNLIALRIRNMDKSAVQRRLEQCFQGIQDLSQTIVLPSKYGLK